MFCFANSPFYLLKFSRALPFYTTSLPLSASLFTNLLFCFFFVYDISDVNNVTMSTEHYDTSQKENKKKHYS